MFDLEFWRSFLSNALATFIGAIIGIPTALWINRIQQKNSEDAEKKKLEIEANSRKRKILQLISDELKANYDFLLKKNYSHFFELQTELWSAFSDGGELEWIQDLDLLQAMASAYEKVKVVIYTGNVYMRTSTQFMNRNYRPEDVDLEHGNLWDQFDSSIDLAIKEINNTLLIINKELHKA